VVLSPLDTKRWGDRGSKEQALVCLNIKILDVSRGRPSQCKNGLRARVNLLPLVSREAFVQKSTERRGIVAAGHKGKKQFIIEFDTRKGSLYTR